MLSSQMVTECTFVYMFVWTFIFFFQTFREGSRFKRIDNRLGWFALMVRMQSLVNVIFAQTSWEGLV